MPHSPYCSSISFPAAVGSGWLSSCCPSGPDPAPDCHPASAAGPGSLPAGLKHKEKEEEGVSVYSSFTKCLHYSCNDEKIGSVYKLGSRYSFLWILTTLQAADSQSLSRVHREAVVAVLDVGLTGHGVEVGLQGELQVVLAGLYLQVRRENVYSHN